MVDLRDIVRIPTLAAVGALVLTAGPTLEVGPVAAQESSESGQTAEGEASGQDSAKNEREEGADAKVNPGAKTPDPMAEGAGESKGKKGQDKKTTGPPLPKGVGEEFAAELKEYRKVYERYAREIKDYQGTVDSIVDAAFKKRRARINEKYDRRSEQLQALERQRRKNAIAKFKEFLDRHPNHPRYTPDAMFRLAELTFEKENDEYMQADAKYRREMERYRAGRRPSPPQAPRRDYSGTIDIFSKLVHDWPNYRLLDGAYYLLAYCHKEMGNARKARDLFAELIVQRPESEFVPEAWIRIGEYHFARSDDPQEIEYAKHAYAQAMKYEDSKFFDKALYKLAWSHYRLDNFHKAIQNFERLVEYSDRQKEKTGESGSVLRAEAVKYMAVSLAEEDWDLDRAIDDAFGMPRVKKYLGEGKSYEREVMVQLVEYLFDNSRYGVATEVIRYALDRFEMHPNNPKLHEKLIVALMRKPRKPDEAFEERWSLMETYGPDSEWYAYQKRKGNEAAVEYGDNLIRENLIQAATWYHEQAQELKDEARIKQDPALLQKARKRYAKAAEAYRTFLERFPDDKDIYRWNFYYADTLYYSGQYQEAYEQYRVVRELDIKDNKFQADAAFNAVKSMEFRIKKLVDAGKLPGFVVPEGGREEARKTAKAQQKQKDKQKTPEAKGEKGDEAAIEPREIPAIVEQYITAMDRYVVLGLDYERQKALGAKFAFNAAKLFYDFKHYDTARERFEWIVDNYPEREEAYLAGSLMLETYRQEKKYDKLAKWANKLSGVLKGEQAKAVKQEVREFKLGAKFKAAEKLFNNEKYEKAAEKYIQLVNEAPEHENAPRALNNAAVAYEKIKKYASAMKLYERVYREYPQSPLSGYALYRVGVNSERFFEFRNAVDMYMLFYEKYEGKSPEELEKMGFQIQDKRPKALLSSAVLSENLQRYRKAANLYEQFVEQYPNNDEAPDAQWQAVEAWKKAGETDRMFAAFDTYKREFGADPKNADNVLEGMMRKAEYAEQQGRKEEAAEKYKEILETFKKRKPKPGSDSAYYAAKAQFQLAERMYTEWRDIKIDGSLSDQKKKLNKKIKKQKKVAKEFKKVWEYKNLEYTLASSFRIGSLFQGFAEALYNVPIPFEPGSEKYMMYRTQLEDIAIPLEDKAVKRYKQTIEKAREEKIVNKWTKKTLNELNKYRPNEYPLYKESKTATQKHTISGRPLLTTVPMIKEDASGMKEGASENEGSDSGGNGASSGSSKSSSKENQRNGESES